MISTLCQALLLGTLPVGSQPAPVSFPHFPSRLHALVWRNWELVPVERLAACVGASPAQLTALAASLGLSPQRPLPADLQRRSYLTVIRRNWHLLPYEQLLLLLDWDAAKLAFTLREDDFLWLKLGALKPLCEPLRYVEPDEATRAAAERFAAVARPLVTLADARAEPLFGFLDELTAPLAAPPPPTGPNRFTPRYCYSYFAPYGDPLLEADLDPYPDGYLDRLVACGVDGVWLPVVLYTLSPFPWEPALSVGWETRLANLRHLATRLRGRGVGLWLYLNEPRALPRSVFETSPDLRGVSEGELASLCTSRPEVRQWLADSVARVFAAAPELAGAFSISASENLTNCWSHHRGEGCPRCGPRGAAAVIAEVNRALAEGVRAGQPEARFIAWDWGWRDAATPEIIAGLAPDTTVMSVSEWSLPIVRGGVAGEVGEYSLSAIGPGPRATRTWELARQRGLSALAKVQLGCTWELSAVPYLPVLNRVAEHLCRLAERGVDGLMLGWTLGGYPSPNLELAGVIGAMARPVPEAALRQVAERRYGAAAEVVVAAWRTMSECFGEFPYHAGLLYRAPLQFGPANLLFERPTGYTATMIGFPYDDLERWRASYPAPVYIDQFQLLADGFGAAARQLRAVTGNPAVAAEADLAEACALHFLTCADQARFVLARERRAAADTPEVRAELAALLDAEAATARRLLALQCRDSRLGFEASNHYYYVPLDLIEKVVCCADLRRRWLGAE